MKEPYKGFYMDNVYRVYDKGQESKTGSTVTKIKLKSIITQPEAGAILPMGRITVLGAAFAGEENVDSVEISMDGGSTWQSAAFVGPTERFAWRIWQYVLEVSQPGSYSIVSRAIDSKGNKQPMEASWNKLGYGNNGVLEHGIKFQVR